MAHLQGSTPLDKLLENVADGALLPLVVALQTMGCLRYAVTPVVHEEPEESVTVAPDGENEDVSGRYLRIKGKNYYEALGLPPTAAPKEIEEACGKALLELSAGSVEPGPARDRILELRRHFKNIRSVLTDPASAPTTIAV